MKKKSLTTRILLIANKMKPILLKIFPIKLLQKIKRDMVTSAADSIGHAHPSPFMRTAYPDGINLIGSIRAETGLGQSARLMAQALSAVSQPFTISNYSPVAALREEDHTWDEMVTNSQPYNVNLIHINPHDLAVAYLQMDIGIWEKRYNIGFWAWELEVFPSDWLPTLALLNEVWTPSDFSGIGLRKVTDKPIHTIPHPLWIPTDPSYDRAFFGLSESQFLFLTMYDCNSFSDRKNPIGAINAYKQAFPIEQHDCGLIIKVNNSQKKDLVLLQEAFKGYKNVYMITETLSKIQVNSLIACSDAFISLHRSEGFGLPLAEAMGLSVPVISTAWSGNMEFMDEETACLVGFDFITIQKTVGPYHAGNRWADPHEEEAAAWICRLYEDRDFAKKVADRAKQRITKQLAPCQVGHMVQKRIRDIYG